MNINEIETKAKDIQRELERLRSKQIREEERRKILEKEQDTIVSELQSLGITGPFDLDSLSSRIWELESEIEKEIEDLEKLIVSQGQDTETR